MQEILFCQKKKVDDLLHVKEKSLFTSQHNIRELMNTVCVVPDFLHDIILGYGDPGAAHYHALQDKRRSEGEKIVEEINFNDTFLSFEHLRHSFPSHEVTVSEKYAKDPKQLIPPFKVTFNAEGEKPGLIAEPYRIERRDPYPIKFPKKNHKPSDQPIKRNCLKTIVSENPYFIRFFLQS